MSDDSEQLLTEALRAQARTTSAQQPHPVRPDPPAMETPGGYGLLSGAEEGSLERERAALDAAATPNHPPEHDERTSPAASAAASSAVSSVMPAAAAPTLSALSAWPSTTWVLLLAASLGLVSGAMVGLFTLL